MDIQLFATDEELQDFPEAKTDSTVPDKTPKSNSINLAASDLPRSHSHLPRIPSRLPERKIRHQSRRDHRRKSRSSTRPKNPIVNRQANTHKQHTVDRQANTHKQHTVDRQAAPSKYPIAGRDPVQAKLPIVDRLAAQTNDQLDSKQRIQWIVSPETYLDRLVGRQGGPLPSEAVLARQPVLGSPEIAPPAARQPVLRSPVVRQPGRQVPSLLSLRLRPDLNALARTLSPQALRYVHLGIQIGQNLLN